VAGERPLSCEVEAAGGGLVLGLFCELYDRGGSGREGLGCFPTLAVPARSGSPGEPAPSSR